MFQYITFLASVDVVILKQNDPVPWLICAAEVAWAVASSLEAPACGFIIGPMT